MIEDTKIGRYLPNAGTVAHRGHATYIFISRDNLSCDKLKIFA